MTKQKKENQQLELFTPLLLGSMSVKDQQDLMQYPFFSLSKSKRISPIEYDDGRVKITVTSTKEHGIASIFDADIIIYIASLIRDHLNRGLPTSRKIKVSRYDVLEFIGKSTSGRGYQQLRSALERLKATNISTTITRENSRFKKYGMWGWLEGYSIIEKSGKPVAIEITLSEWLYDGIIDDKLLLTLSRDYFQLDGGLEKFIYRLCRKVVGTSNILQMKLQTVHKRSGTTRKPGKFKSMIEGMMEKQSIPDYWVFVTKRPSTGDDYLCACPKDKFKTYETALMNACSFLAMDRALLRAKTARDSKVR